MIDNSFFHRIQAIAEANPGGFTVKFPTLEPVTEGIAVAYYETQDSHDISGLYHCIEHAITHDQTLGGWQDEDSGRYYFDSVRIFFDLEEAIRFGRENEQIAIYDITNKRLIKL